MRLKFLVLSIFLFLLLGALFSVLNAEKIALDFYFIEILLPKGAVLLTALLLGWFVGGVVAYVGCARRYQRKLRITPSVIEPVASLDRVLVDHT